jgi:hypothetical protein
MASWHIPPNSYDPHEISKEGKNILSRRNKMSLLDKILKFPSKLGANLKCKLESKLYENLIKVNWNEIRFSPGILSNLEERLKLILKENIQAPPVINERDKKLVDEILIRVKRENRNNITRTEAYRQFYFSNPEIHWSFLAHMVSRNGGWNMTDLKGNLLPYLLNQEQQHHFFAFLERANGLIFQDAYPQLLLYEESKKRNEMLFHLLPYFHVSSFMSACWEMFWLDRDPRLITLALIINEQNYIQSRVAENPFFRNHVFQTPAFISQAALQLNQILLPFYPRERTILTSVRIRLAGRVIENFTNLAERIGVGIQLYILLFGSPEIHKGAISFAKEKPHTGSRSDYWPDLFTHYQEKSKPNKYGPERLIACKLNQNSPKLYSPRLTDAWSDQPFTTPERTDWFRDISVMEHFKSCKAPRRFEMTCEACSALNRIELAVLVKESLNSH